MEVKGINIPLSKLATVAPNVSLQEYLKIGLRPSMRKSTEFRPVTVSKAGLSRYEEGAKQTNQILGSAVVKSGVTDVICTITGGVVEDSQALTNDYRLKLDKDIIDMDETAHASEEAPEETYSSVYSVVEIATGRNGPPSEEEIGLGQRLYSTVLHSKLIPKDILKVSLGLKSKDEKGNPVVLYPEDDAGGILQDVGAKKSFSYVLYAKLNVYSKTGPLFDLCYGALLEALKNTQLPGMYINEEETDVDPTMARSGGRGDAQLIKYDLLCDPVKSYHLQIDDSEMSWSSTFAVATKADGTNVLLADPEGAAESAITKTIDVVCDGTQLYSLEVTGKVSLKELDEAIDTAGRRAEELA